MLLGAALGTVLVAALATPAFAHPFGSPPTAVVYGSDRSVVIEWESAPDDAIAIGVHVGLLPPETIDSYLDGATERPPSAADEELLTQSAELRAYLLEHIRVFQDGQRCSATVQPILDFVGNGATVVHECPVPVDTVDIEISMLHDVHEAYRTFAGGVTDTSPAQAVYTTTVPRHTWTFGVAPGPGWSVNPILAVVLAAGVLGLAAYRWQQRRDRGERGRKRPERLIGRSREALRTGTRSVVPISLVAAAEPQRIGWLEGEFIGLIDRQGAGLAFAALALVIAFGIGAFHALAPGHGKGLIGAYLVGTRGRPRDALALGTVVAVMHCASVLVFGGVLFATVSLRADVGQVMPWMSLAAGALITAVGAGLVARQARLRAAGRALVTEHAGTGHHGHGGVHDHGHGHDHHLPAGVNPLSRRGIVALGVSGGLLPSPSAFIVLATGILMGRALFGLLLVAAFSIGLAATLTAFGLAAIKGRMLVERRAVSNPRLARFTAVLPMITSVAVLGGGLWITTIAILRL